MKNWKTSAAALIGVIVTLVNKYAGLDLPPELILIGAMSLMALVTKDFDTTGNGSDATKDQNL